jgi:hypothetical protein
MKIITVVLLILLITQKSFSQDFSISIYAEDVNGRKDTVMIGMNGLATIDIDSFLSETDYYSVPYDSLEIRVIHRDSIEHHCLQGYTSQSVYGDLYFSNNVDLKNDYRPYYGIYGTIYTNFEIIVSCISPPVAITVDFSGIAATMWDGWSQIVKLDSNCNIVDDKTVCSYCYDIGETIFTSNENLSTFIVLFGHEVGINDYPKFEEVMIYPNPTNNEINIDTEEMGTLELINMQGQIVDSKSLTEKSNNLDLSNLVSGVYTLRIKTDRGIAIRKLIKQ